MLNWANAVYTVFILEVCIYLHMFIEALYSATIMVTSSLLYVDIYLLILLENI